MCAKQYKSRILVAFLMVAGALAGNAAVTITNVQPVNVTPTSFGVVWRAGVNYTPSIAVFADAAGKSNITSQLGVTLYPLHTGNPNLDAGYARRQSRIDMNKRTEGMSLAFIQVNGCKPQTPYYFQLTSTPSSGSALVYPALGTLPGVTTAKENSFVINDQPLIIDVPGLDSYGQVVVLSFSNSVYPLAATVGDGVATNQVFFNFNDLIAPVGLTNVMPSGSQTFSLSVLGLGGIVQSGQFTLSFSQSFGSSQPSVFTFGTEFLYFAFSSAVLQTGQTSNIPLMLKSSASVASLDVSLNLPASRFTNMTLTTLSSEIDPAAVSVTVKSASNVVLHLPALSNQSITGSKQIANFNFKAVTNQHSAFVPVGINQLTATKSGGALVTNLDYESGRIVVVGRESLLENTISENGGQNLTLYANPMHSYSIEYSTNSDVWVRMHPLAVTQLVTSVSGVPTTSPSIFYRAVQYDADPSILEAHGNADGTRSLVLFGKPGSKYAIQAATTINAITWTTVANVTLQTTPFLTIPIDSKNTYFYRAVENP